jgi:hypothetical protein
MGQCLEDADGPVLGESLDINHEASVNVKKNALHHRLVLRDLGWNAVRLVRCSTTQRTCLNQGLEERGEGVGHGHDKWKLPDAAADAAATAMLIKFPLERKGAVCKPVLGTRSPHHNATEVARIPVIWHSRTQSLVDLTVLVLASSDGPEHALRGKVLLRVAKQLPNPSRRRATVHHVRVCVWLGDSLRNSNMPKFIWRENQVFLHANLVRSKIYIHTSRINLIKFARCVVVAVTGQIGSTVKFSWWSNFPCYK